MKTLSHNQRLKPSAKDRLTRLVCMLMIPIMSNALVGAPGSGVTPISAALTAVEQQRDHTRRQMAAQADAPTTDVTLTPRTVKRNERLTLKRSPKITLDDLPAEPDDTDLENTRIFGRPLKPQRHGKKQSKNTLQNGNATTFKGTDVQSDDATRITRRKENKDLLATLRAYDKAGSYRNWRSAETLDNFLATHPETDWTASLLLQKASILKRHGFFGEALKTQSLAWDAAKEHGWWDTDHELCEQIFVDGVNLRLRLGRIEEAKQWVEEVSGYSLGGAGQVAKDKTREWIYYFEHNPAQDLQCGVSALNTILIATTGGGAIDADLDWNDQALRQRLLTKGMSLTEVLDIAKETGLQLQAARRISPKADIPVPAVIHWKFGHFSALTEKGPDGWRLVDPFLDHDGWMSSEALQQESSGVFLIPAGPLPKGWEAVTEAAADIIYGRHCTHGRNEEGPQTTQGGGGKCNEGMIGYTFRALDAGIILTDTPLWHTPPVGPSVAFTATYDQRSSAIPASQDYGNLGPRWTYNWLSYLKLQGTGMPMTKIQLVQGNATYQTYTYSTTAKTYSNLLGATEELIAVNATRYELVNPDGSRRVYSQPDATIPTRLFLTEIIDPQGNSVKLDYDEQLRLVQIRDALNQPTIITYGGKVGDTLRPLLISKITDPFNRTAIFSYDSTGHLAKITDMAGLTSEIVYGTTENVTSVTTPYGATKFRSGGTSPNYYAEVEDALGDIERIEATDAAQVPGNEAANAAPASKVTINGQPVTFLTYNSNLYWRNTFYWDKQAYKRHKGDYTKATLTHWLADSSSQTVSIPESEKSPEQERVWYNYPGQTQANIPGSQPYPNKIARVLPDGTTQLTQYTRNTRGNLTNYTDPVGRTTLYTYAANGMDLTEATNILHSGDALTRERLFSATYDTRHLPLTVTDAAGQTTRYTYNARGQLLTATNALSQTTTYDYDNNGYLLAIDGPLPGNQDRVTLTYDDYGRPRTVTTPDDGTLTYDYDIFNRVTQVTYPDATTEKALYNRLDREWTQDRLGRWTRTWYDAMRRAVMTRDTAGHVTTYDWCRCGALNLLVDPEGRQTRWYYNLDGNLLTKTHADGATENYEYDRAGRLSKTTNARGQVQTYTYNKDNSLAATTGDGAVTLTYDPAYARLASMADALGTTSYTYYPYNNQPGAGRVQTISRLDTGAAAITADTITYAYDVLGRLTTQTIARADGTLPTNASSYTYDTLSRPTQITTPLGALGLTYQGATLRPTQITRPNALTTNYTYQTPTAPGGALLASITNTQPTGEVSAHSYQYDPAGRITQWLSRASGQTQRTWEPGYDRADQLSGVSENGDTRYTYRYDKSGNRLSEQIAQRIAAAAYNNTNQLTKVTPGGPYRIEGTVDEPADVTVNGVNASVDTQNRFRADVPLEPGQREIEVKATDGSGNTSTRRYQLTVEANGQPRTLTYDLDGNLLDDGADKTYTWDAINRLIKITFATPEAGQPNVIEFAYDGYGQRVQETHDGVVVKRWLWAGGYQPAEERDANNRVTKRYYAGIGEQTVATNNTTTNYYYTTDHLGSVRELIDGGGNIRARYDYDPFGRRSKVQGDLDTAFGFTGHLYHNESKLSLTYYRAYDPALGRWLSRDPIAERGGLNLYAYVGNRALNHIDSMGLFDGIFAPPNSTYRLNSVTVYPVAWNTNHGQSTTQKMNEVGSAVNAANSARGVVGGGVSLPGTATQGGANVGGVGFAALALGADQVSGQIISPLGSSGEQIAGFGEGLYGAMGVSSLAPLVGIEYMEAVDAGDGNWIWVGPLWFFHPIQISPINDYFGKATCHQENEWKKEGIINWKNKIKK